jgi:hypothetical protein
MIIPSGIWQHYKGGMYLVLGVSQMSGTEDDPKAELFVVYVPLYKHKGAGLILRPALEFIETVDDPRDSGAQVNRFRYVGVNL